jgi:hypothetical protein
MRVRVRLPVIEPPCRGAWELRAVALRVLERAQRPMTAYDVMVASNHRKSLTTAGLVDAIEDLAAAGLVSREVRMEPRYHGSRVMIEHTYYQLTSQP